MTPNRLGWLGLGTRPIRASAFFFLFLFWAGSYLRTVPKLIWILQRERKLTCFRGLLKKEACSFWLMLLSPLLAFLLLSLFFLSWFASVHSPLFAFPGLPCVVRPLELCPPVLVFLSVYSLSFVFVCPLFTSPVLWFFCSSVCVLSVSVIFRLSSVYITSSFVCPLFTSPIHLSL